MSGDGGGGACKLISDFKFTLELNCQLAEEDEDDKKFFRKWLVIVESRMNASTSQCRKLIEKFIGILEKTKRDSSEYSQILTDCAESQPANASAHASPMPTFSMTGSSGTNNVSFGNGNTSVVVGGDYVVRQGHSNHDDVSSAQTALLSTQHVMAQMKKQYGDALSVKLSDDQWKAMWGAVLNDAQKRDQLKHFCDVLSCQTYTRKHTLCTNCTNCTNTTRPNCDGNQNDVLDLTQCNFVEGEFKNFFVFEFPVTWNEAKKQAGFWSLCEDLLTKAPNARDEGAVASVLHDWAHLKVRWMCKHCNPEYKLSRQVGLWHKPGAAHGRELYHRTAGAVCSEAHASPGVEARAEATSWLLWRGSR
jgi:hypothetical protein